MSEDKALTKVKSLARSYTDKAIETLGGIMAQPRCSDAARVAAAKELLDRGWGKPTQPHGGDDDAPAIRVDQNVTVKIVDSTGGQ